VASSDIAYRLAGAQFRASADSFLSLLVAQRSLFAARQAQTATLSNDLQNRISLYQALGGEGTVASTQSGGADQRATNR
jgi:outer membrane protein, multidrug efflux system